VWTLFYILYDNLIMFEALARHACRKFFAVRLPAGITAIPHEDNR
jgi:hypothetical protein